MLEKGICSVRAKHSGVISAASIGKKFIWAAETLHHFHNYEMPYVNRRSLCSVLCLRVIILLPLSCPKPRSAVWLYHIEDTLRVYYVYCREVRCETLEPQ